MPKKHQFLLLLAGLLLYVAACSTQKSTDQVADNAYQPVIALLEDAIQYQMKDKALPAVSIALVDDQKVVWAKGFGFADPENKKRASANTIYRVGSVSKLFTDIAIMQLVEKGEIELDAPVTTYLPEFAPRNSFEKKITLRQLMSHRSGLVREPPVGHYFDPTAPTLQATVASLNETELVYEPEARTKYSNAGIATVGYVLEKLKNQPFAEYVREAVLRPLGMQVSAFAPSGQINVELAKAEMWSYDGRSFAAPTFELWMSPAGSMYAPVLELAQFMKVLFNDGIGPNGIVLQPETLQQMWTPQFADTGERYGFGIGFSLSELEGQLCIGHGGAIYGFATQLSALPDSKLGVIVVTSMDIANSAMTQIADLALQSMLAHKNGKSLPAVHKTSAINPELARALDGTYHSGDHQIELVERNGELYLWHGSMRLRLKQDGYHLVADDRHGYGTLVMPQGTDVVKIGDRRYERVPSKLPPLAKSEFLGLIGEYGWDHNVLFVFEKNNQLHCLIEWGFVYPLQQIDKDVFAFPDYGLYHGEKLQFKRDAMGRAERVISAGIQFDRRSLGVEDGATFRIEPVQPVEALRKIARAATPPEQADDLLLPDLVELSTLDSTLKFDIRYATTNNFMSTVFYKQPRAFMQRPASQALIRAHQKLKKQGYGLLIHDAYRPWFVTKMFWDATPENMKDFVADPQSGSIHNRGAAVDLTLYDLETGKPAQMVGGYDEFSERSFPQYVGGTSRQRWLRELLRDAMEEEGFEVYRYEWWHFNDQNAAKYPILNLEFDEL